jgi:hypothetical protein
MKVLDFIYCGLRFSVWQAKPLPFSFSIFPFTKRTIWPLYTLPSIVWQLKLLLSQNSRLCLNSNIFHSLPASIHQYLYLTFLVIVLSISKLQSNIIVKFPGKGEKISTQIQFINNGHSNLKMRYIEVQLFGTVQYAEKMAIY